ncbi:MAG: Holliday junction resolvase RuvX [Prevotellaceae bacterium]|jgi:putative Holliday junction resolvase|nr:Holliday junction resolvase RuvX [Prevotellaceae bacterium]
MNRIIGIDYGRKRVGIAVTDPLQLFATTLDTVAAKEVIEYLITYSGNEPVERFVVGYPKNLNNTPTETAPYVDAFLKQLQAKFPVIPVTLVDERFTSRMALRAMIDGGVKKMARREKATVDKVSAALILQGYLDSRKYNLIK